MQKAQEFLISYLKSTGDSYETIEEKSCVSKSTICRMMHGNTVSVSSLHRIAESYGKLEEFLALQSAAADPKRAADDLHEMYEHAEQLLAENCEERIRAMESAHQQELSAISISHQRTITALESSVASERRYAHLFICLFVCSLVVCLLLICLSAFYVSYDVSHPEMGLFGFVRLFRSPLC